MPEIIVEDSSEEAKSEREEDDQGNDSLDFFIAENGIGDIM